MFRVRRYLDNRHQLFMLRLLHNLSLMGSRAVRKTEGCDIKNIDCKKENLFLQLSEAHTAVSRSLVLE